MSITDDISILGNHIIKLQEKAIKTTLELYEPKINLIINSKSNDINLIERTLDALLDFAFDDKVLFLYRKLCKYCLYINPVTTKFYINSYREMWDDE